jgi:L-ascorbate metabolism protein UlaG (beta-lactamase superfamily)
MPAIEPERSTPATFRFQNSEPASRRHGPHPRPDIAVLPVGGKYNMGVREAGYAAGLIHPKVFIPIHFDTFPNQRLDQDRLEQEIRFRAPHVAMVRWKPGDTWEYR